MRKSKGSFNGEPAVPHYPDTPEREYAKHVRLMANRYLRDLANLNEFRDAMTAACKGLASKAEQAGAR